MRRCVARVGNEVPRMTFLFFLLLRSPFSSGEPLVPAIYARLKIPRLRPGLHRRILSRPVLSSHRRRTWWTIKVVLAWSFRAEIFKSCIVEGGWEPLLEHAAFLSFVVLSQYPIRFSSFLFLCKRWASPLFSETCNFVRSRTEPSIRLKV